MSLSNIAFRELAVQTAAQHDKPFVMSIKELVIDARPPVKPVESMLFVTSRDRF